MRERLKQIRAVAETQDTDPRRFRIELKKQAACSRDLCGKNRISWIAHRRSAEIHAANADLGHRKTGALGRLIGIAEIRARIKGSAP